MSTDKSSNKSSANKSIREFLSHMKKMRNLQIKLEKSIPWDFAIVSSTTDFAIIVVMSGDEPLDEVFSKLPEDLVVRKSKKVDSGFVLFCKEV